MKIGILGSGIVGNTLGKALLDKGHEVMMGSRTAKSEAGEKWLAEVNNRGQLGTFADTAAFGEIVLDCTNGANSLKALQSAGAENLRDKILIQISNPLDFSKGTPPTLTICNDDSLGERIQLAFPETRVVKALNTVNCDIMVEPDCLAEETQLIICGNDAEAKSKVTELLGDWFGGKRENVIDLGEIEAARGTEMYLALWIRLMDTLGTPHFNLRLVKEK